MPQSMHLRRALTRLLAAVMLLTAAVAPLRHPSHAGPLLTVEICSGDGIVLVQLDADGAPVAPEPAAAPCQICHALPTVAVPPQPVVPSLDRLVVAHDLTRPDAAPRGPPPHILPNHPPTAPPRLA
jgi:hypothetical protein